jgi:hypothetical protein
MAAWPGTIPTRHLLDGLVYAPSDQAIRTKPDTGPTYVRRRYSTGVAEYQIPVLFSGTELTAFETFYVTTLSGGTDSFTMTDAALGGTATFVFLERPAFTPLRPRSGIRGALWRGVLRVERQS